MVLKSYKNVVVSLYHNFSSLLLESLRSHLRVIKVVLICEDYIAV